MPRRFDSLLDALATSRVSDRACNQYSRIEGDVAANAVRRRNLRLYLQELDAIGPDTLLVGEAPSYRGGRVTGIAFVSERVMLDGVSIRSAPGHILGKGYLRAVDEGPLTTEASATMVWETIRNLDPLPMLWNAFPFHPFHRGNPKSNRIPDAAEIAIGQEFLRMLIRLFGFRSIVAIGNQAAASLSRMGIGHHAVRHPSMGGKAKFIEGMARLSQWAAGQEETMASSRESQIQQIKNGRAMTEHRYNNRNQPSGPPAPLPTKNAVRLSTVPASAKEKYNGGKD